MRKPKEVENGQGLNAATVHTENGNVLVTREQFDRLVTPRIVRTSTRPQAKALWALSPGSGLVMEHGEYLCNRVTNGKGRARSCSLSSVALSIGRRRGLLVTCKHLIDGRMAIFYEEA